MSLRADAAAHFDISTVLLKNFAGDPQSQSCTFLAFGGEERFKEVSQRLRGNAFAIVSYQDGR